MTTDAPDYDAPAHCPKDGCGKPLVQTGPEMSTLVGYSSPEGHDHDDNCRKRYYRCLDGHGTALSAINRCSVVDCGWVGKLACFCSTKVPRFPDVPEELAPQWADLRGRIRT